MGRHADGGGGKSLKRPRGHAYQPALVDMDACRAGFRQQYWLEQALYSLIN
jgi:hypothetical protein